MTKDGIQERLSRVETELIHAAAEGAPALTRFGNNLSTLLGDVELALRTEMVSEETAALANAATSRVEVLLECLLDFHISADTRGRGLEPIFAHIHTKDIAEEESPQPTPYASRRAPAEQPTYPSCPPYIEPAYRWLITNLHNPYPPIDIKDAIALKTSSYRKVVDAWFVDARKRMGWNALRRERFSNKRIDIVDAATRFFLQDDAKRPLDPNVALEFVAIEKRAKDLYSNKFTESTLAAKLDIALKDLTTEMKAHAKVVEREQKKQAKLKVELAASASYPSPSHSNSTTPPTPTLTPLSEEDEISLDAFAGSKRRSVSLESSDSPSVYKPNKRSRVESPSCIAAMSLPSPALSLNETPPTTNSNLSVPPLSVTSDALPISSTSRKRRLSNTDGPGTPKRPRNVYAKPRVHAVSDPLPMSCTLSSWFESNFGIPSAVTVEEPESSSLDVELYEYSALDSIFQLNSPEAHSTVGASSHRSSPHTLDVVTSLEIPPAVSEVQSYPLNISTNTSNYDEIFWEPGDIVADFAGQSLANQDSSVPAFDLSSDLNVSSNFFNSFATFRMAPMTDTTVVPGSPVSTSCNSTSNVDWTFPPILLSQNTFNSLSDPDLSLNTFPQDENLMFNSLIMGNSVSQMLVQSDKAAKQRKLVEMKEATRRLELEIAAS